MLHSTGESSSVPDTNRTVGQNTETLSSASKYASDKPIKTESSVQPSKDALFHSSIDITVKCESIELNDVFDMDRNWKETEPGTVFQENIEELYLKSEFKVEPDDGNLLLTTECETDPKDISTTIDGPEFSYEDAKIDINETKVSEAFAVKWKEKEQENYALTNKFMEEMSPKFEMKVEQMDDNLSILTEQIDDTESASSDSDRNEISFEDTKISIGEATENSCLRSVNVTGNFIKCKKTDKNNSTNLKNHKTANEFKCDVCSKCFSSRSGLFYHKSTHTGKKPYQCDLCNDCFPRLFNLKLHRLKHTGEKPYRCNICNKGFARSSDLITHKRIHTGEEPYQCDFCNKNFSQSSNLNKHKRIHTGEKPYRCDICNKCFSQSSDLTNHKRIHTGEKPYQCDLCNNCFSHLSSLKLHKLNHTGEKPYQCDICNKCFSKPSALLNHKRIHTGEKPYQCDLCNKCFSQSSHLYRHKRVHTDEKPYQCDFSSVSQSHPN